MQSKILVKWSLFVVSLVGAALSVVIILFVTANLPVQGLAMAVTSSAGQSQTNLNNSKLTQPDLSLVVFPTKANLGLPTHLKIPKIKVDTLVESVGLTSQGAVGVPQGLINVAWFNLGPRPGDSGNAIIDGHYGYWKNGLAGVFNNLSKLRPGDQVLVADDKGETTIFLVREIKTYDPKADATEVFNSNDGQSHLNLITCEGVWDKVSQSYSKRLVVFTDKE